MDCQERDRRVYWVGWFLLLAGAVLAFGGVLSPVAIGLVPILGMFGSSTILILAGTVAFLFWFTRRR